MRGSELSCELVTIALPKMGFEIRQRDPFNQVAASLADIALLVQRDPRRRSSKPATKRSLTGNEHTDG
jgi:hypothetical protein